MIGEDATRLFFDGMARSYDRDLLELGWDPVGVTESFEIEVSAGDMTILDAGCGTGQLLAHFAALHSARGLGCAVQRLCGFDLSSAMLAEARSRPELLGANLRRCSASERWPFDAEMADLVFAFGMLEFVQDLRAAFLEMQRVLKRGGFALFSVEDVMDWEGQRHDELEYRYDAFPLYRRSRGRVLAALPETFEVIAYRRVPAYRVLEYGFTTAYHVMHVRRP